MTAARLMFLLFISSLSFGTKPKRWSLESHPKKSLFSDPDKKFGNSVHSDPINYTFQLGFVCSSEEPESDDFIESPHDDFEEQLHSQRFDDFFSRKSFVRPNPFKQD